MQAPAIAISQNLRKSFGALASHSPDGATAQFESVTAVSAGVPTPTFNRVFVFDSFEKSELMDAINWFKERDDPFWVTALDSYREDIEDTFRDLSYEQSETPQPGMARPLSADLPSPETDADIERVTDTAGIDAWVTVADSVFDFSSETSRLITPDSILKDEDLQYFLGTIDGEPGACGLLFMDGAVAGVYVIGVDEAFRRRGIGEAMTWAVLHEGHTGGAEMGVLQSTQMGFPLYEQMGFETEVEFRHFALEN